MPVFIYTVIWDPKKGCHPLFKRDSCLKLSSSIATTLLDRWPGASPASIASCRYITDVSVRTSAAEACGRIVIQRGSGFMVTDARGERWQFT